MADLRAGGGEADDQASVLGALLGPGGGGSGAGLARRDSGSSFRSSRLGPLDDMVLEAGLQARRRTWGRVGVCFRLPWPCRAAPGRHAPDLRLRSKPARPARAGRRAQSGRCCGVWVCFRPPAFAGLTPRLVGDPVCAGGPNPETLSVPGALTRGS